MKIHGYTDDKDAVAVDLPIDTIVEAGVDPWRLDLFDRAPIALDTPAGRLNFRKLQNIAFCYTQGEQCIVGIQDGKDTMCVAGLKGNEHMTLDLDKPRAVSFSQHFGQYLTMWCEELARRAREAEETTKNSGSSRAAFPSPNHEDRLSRFLKGSLKTQHGDVFEPKECDAVELLADKVRFNWNSAFTLRPKFAGATVDEISVTTYASAAIAWVFETFSAFHPTVFGEAINRTLRNEPPGPVTFLVDIDGGAIDVIEKLVGRKLTLSQKSYGRFEFNQSGCQYKALLNQPGAAFTDWMNELSTGNALFMTAPDKLRGMRLAFYDVGKGQDRSLSLESAARQ